MKKTLIFITAAVMTILLVVLLLCRSDILVTTPSAPPVMTPEELVPQLLDSFADADGHITDEITSLLDSFTKFAPLDAARWHELLEYWDYVNNRMTVNIDSCEKGLADDNSLCIVVLGFQLEEDGGMRPELVKRLETALKCAIEYPNAYVAVTGGGTARFNSEASEAGAMAQWLIDNGISPERIIVENNSLTTAQNAVFTDRIFKSAYPEISSLVIVTSEYHVRRGCMVFETEAILTDSDIRVVSNIGCDTGRAGRDPVRIQEHDIMQVVDYYYNFRGSEPFQPVKVPAAP